MQLGMVGLGRMGGNMARRLMRGGHTCIVYDRSVDATRALAGDGAVASTTLDDFVGQLTAPRVVWLMLPAAIVDATIAALEPRLKPGDIIVDGGNSFYRDDVDRAKRLAGRGLHYVDCGTSGGVWGLERGYCLMIGGEPDVVKHLDPIFAALAPGGDVRRKPDTTKAMSKAQRRYLHSGPPGAGHFVKMIHNGIEYGLMAAYAEGFNILKHANAGKRDVQATAEHAPLRDPQYFQFDFDLPAIAEVWRHGSVVSSWLLDLTAAALGQSPDLATFAGRVSDSGEGRWTIEAAIEEGVPADVLAAALFARFTSRGEADFQNRLLSAMRFAFGGHVEQHA
jgi:6-phosphogluconate dehydrogenase